jgi:natural product biosynthesis luciferase-like monooxygenase protein
MSERTSCFIIGDGALPIRCGEMLRAAGVLVHGVVADQEDTLAWAAAHGIPTLPGDGDLHEWMARRPFDFLFNIVNFTIPDPEVLALPRRMAVNFHDGPLPRYGGIHPTSWAILAGEADYGVVWHRMIDELDRGQVFLDTAAGKRRKAVDTGRILEREAVAVAADETAASLNTRCFEAGLRAFARLLARIEDGTLDEGEVQDLDQRSYFAKYERPAAAGLLDPDAAEEAARLVRAADFAPYANPFVAAKLLSADGPVVVQEAQQLDGRFEVLALATPEGAPLEAPWPPFLEVPADASLRATLDRLQRRSVRAEEAWLEALAPFEALRLDGEPAAELQDSVRLDLPSACQGEMAPAAILAALGRLHGQAQLGCLWQESAWTEAPGEAAAFYAPAAPLALDLEAEADLAGFAERVAATREAALRRGPFLRDLLGRHPHLHGLAAASGGVAADLLLRWEPRTAAEACGGARLVVDFLAGGTEAELHDFTTDGRLEALLPRLRHLLEAFAAAPEDALRGHLVLLEEERQRLRAWGRGPRVELPPTTTLLDAIQEQARAHPNRPAVTGGEATLSYQELDVRANRLAHRLGRSGVRRGDLVGLCLPREVDLLVAVLATWKCGAAYVPLDPAYPRDRLRFMAEDAKLRAILADAAHAALLPTEGAALLLLDRVLPEAAAEPETAPAGGPRQADLAYVIYTSGSTGRPKGVMVEHRQLLNFAAAMEPHLEVEGLDGPGRWLAVTSLNFDISVLELLVTLGRGMEVVLHREEEAAVDPVPQEHGDRPLAFSLSYFGTDGGASGRERYRLLEEGVRFADRHGFAAVWTPERHFHAFGGHFPNPAVTSAALATITERLQLRAGSCVVPLHHPLRIAEEWAVVDNLSDGRAGIALASGWQPNDFVLRPEAYEERHRLLEEGIDGLRALWRGEAMRLADGRGEEVEVVVHPRPVQPELPLWLTAAGNPETFHLAGRKGCHVLTHLLGQDDEELRERIDLYRAAWREAGHPGEGQVALMVHSYVGASVEEARAAVEQPMKDYLRTAVSLVEKAAWEWPAYREKVGGSGAAFRPEELAEEDVEAILDFAFHRYFEKSGLFGDADRAVAFADRMKGLGVDELGCLVDFGVPAEQVLAQLPRLEAVMRRVNRAPESEDASAEDGSILGLLRRHRPTHLQCTPSMARMMVHDEETREALVPLDRLLIGGEAFPPDLARLLETTVQGKVLNMYGPTETTIWSTVHELDGIVDQVPIGRPLANTDVLVLDPAGEPVPPGALGELCLGGEGVTRGYLDRLELTAARYVPYRYVTDRDARLYRTGDLVRWDEEGNLEFHGRLDQQVKLRGHRIELGEVEAALADLPEVREAVALVREDVPGDQRLVAYLCVEEALPEPGELRARLRARLPESAMPQVFCVLDRFPTTPNRKIDRKAFPPPQLASAADEEVQAPKSATEEELAAIWCEVLGLERVGRDRNFFELGGHSLLSVKVQIEVKQRLGRQLGLVDLFRHPTLRGLAAFLDGTGDEADLSAATDRAQARRAARGRRRRR